MASHKKKSSRSGKKKNDAAFTRLTEMTAVKPTESFVEELHSQVKKKNTSCMFVRILS